MTLVSDILTKYYRQFSDSLQLTRENSFTPDPVRRVRHGASRRRAAAVRRNALRQRIRCCEPAMRGAVPYRAVPRRAGSGVKEPLRLRRGLPDITYSSIQTWVKNKYSASGHGFLMG